MTEYRSAHPQQVLIMCPWASHLIPGWYSWCMTRTWRKWLYRQQWLSAHFPPFIPNDVALPQQMYDLTTETAPFVVLRLLLSQVKILSVVFYYVEYGEIWQKNSNRLSANVLLCTLLIYSRVILFLQLLSRKISKKLCSCCVFLLRHFAHFTAVKIWIFICSNAVITRCLLSPSESPLCSHAVHTVFNMYPHVCLSHFVSEGEYKLCTCKIYILCIVFLQMSLQRLKRW